MIAHVSLGTRNYPASVSFYERVLAPIGLRLMRDIGKEAAFGTQEHWCFFLYPVSEAESVQAGGLHVAFQASTREQVQAVHRAALAAGARDIFAPKTRPDISPTYFGAMFEDPEGRRLEVLTDAS